MEINVCTGRQRKTDSSWQHLNPTPRIPYSCYYCYVTKSVKWRYLGNQAWYHRSAGVKTTGKILNKKIPPKKWYKMVPNGSKWSKTAKKCQNCQKWSKWSKMV